MKRAEVAEVFDPYFNLSLRESRLPDCDKNSKKKD